MKPFKVADTPARNTNETRPVAAPPAGTKIIESAHSGNPLPPSSTDGVDHNPEIKWPQPAMGVDHKPFKNTK